MIGGSVMRLCSIEVADGDCHRVHVHDGPPGAATIVLLHGWTSTAEINWCTAIPALAQRYRIVAPDLRGHSHGPRSGRRATLSAAADDVAAVIEATSAGPVIVVGYSMGAAVAQVLAHRRPDLVGALVLCAAAEQYRAGIGGALRVVGLVVGAGVARLVPATVTTRVAQVIMTMLFGANEYQRWVNAEMARHSWREVLDLGASLGFFDSSRWVGTLAPPVVAVITTGDTHVPPAHQWQLAADTDATVHLVDGDHSVCLARADLFVPPLLGACRDAAEALAAGDAAPVAAVTA